MKTLVAVAALAAASPAFAVTRSHTSAVKQNSVNQSWTETCMVKVIGVSSLKPYWGQVWIRYNDPTGEVEFYRTNYYIGPGYPTFSYVHDGYYTINATLGSNNTVTVTFSATRYGPLYQWTDGAGKLQEGGTFTCVGSIFYDNGSTKAIHNIFAEEHVGSWQ